jgi:Cu(I)/Ag(I) efflux system membrane fusion protein
MKILACIASILALLVVGFIAGASWSHRGVAPASTEAKALYYACPMHPQYHSDRAGDCPSCGMRLEPVYADRVGAPAPGAGGSPLPAGAVQVSSERQQAIGVRLGVAEKASGTRTLRTTGRVVADENATYPLVSGVDARVREVRSPTAGTLVKKNELLASLYAPELLASAQGYLVALYASDRLATTDPNQTAAARTSLQRAEEALRNLGVSEGQIEELRTTRQSSPSITIASPVDGFILQRNILAGQRVDRGTELYRIADLRRVWILADVYENQLPFIRSGMKAAVTSAQQNRRYEAVVSATQPIFDDATRTMKVRLETDNPGFALKPGMFVDVAFAIDVPATLAVPADAIVDTGLRKTLFVDRGNGFFEPRQVETGWRIGDQVEIVKGLMAGERIVIAGTFLIDSESRMKAAAQGMFGAVAKDPICGMDVDQKRATAAGRTSEYKGATYYFCSDGCKKDFDKDPAKYAAK